jgi:hypothetical protein
MHHVISAEDSDEVMEHAERNLSENELEEEEEEVHQVPEKIQRVIDDAHDVARSLEESDLPMQEKRMAVAEARAIARDAEELVGASSAKAMRLKADMKERLANLKQYQDQEEEDEEEEEDNSPAGRVVRDVKEARASISNDDSLSHQQKAHALRILVSMEDNARSYNDAEDKSEIKHALKRQPEELKEVVGEGAERDQEEEEEEEDEEVHESRSNLSLEEKAERVESDAEEVKREIRHDSSLSASAKQAAIANLDAIERDAEEYAQASAERRHSLKRAMELRVSALRDQVEQ